MFDLSSSSLLHLLCGFLSKRHALLLFPFLVIASSPLKSQYSLSYHLSTHPSQTELLQLWYIQSLKCIFLCFHICVQISGFVHAYCWCLPQDCFYQTVLSLILMFVLFFFFNSHSPPSSVIICSLSEWVYSLTLTLGPFIFSGPLALMACHLFSDLSKHISRFSF